MKWPWADKKPVHDPTRNYDIHTIYLNDSWTYPDTPSYTFPDNFWSQILGVSFKLTTIAGIRGATSFITISLSNQSIPIFQHQRGLWIKSSLTTYIHWSILGATSSTISLLLPNCLCIPNHLYAFPNNELSFESTYLLAGDTISDMTIRVKRWEFY